MYRPNVHHAIGVAVALSIVLAGASFAQPGGNAVRQRSATTLDATQLNARFAQKTEGQIGDARYQYTLSAGGTAIAWVDGPQPPAISNPDADLDKWYVARRIDGITDEVNWSIAKYEPKLIFNFNTKGSLVQLCAMAHSSKSQSAYIRIDKHPAIPLQDDGCTYDSTALAEIKSQLQTGQSTLVRTYNWSNDVSSDTRFDSSDFKIVLALYVYLRSRME